MAAILVLLALIPWLAARPSLDRLRDCGTAALATLVVASPQVAAMAWQASTGDRGDRFDYRADGVSVYRPDRLRRGTPQRHRRRHDM